MTAEKFRACLAEIGWSQRALAARLGVNDVTVRRWALDGRRMPEEVGEWLGALSDFHAAHRLPAGWD